MPPPAETSYTVVDSQIKVPPTASKRLGFQPVVELKVNGKERADIRAGQQVTFTARIETPPNTGKIILAEWDFMGAGDYPVADNISKPEPAVDIEKTFTFSKPGTYFPVLRATSQREGDTDTPYALWSQCSCAAWDRSPAGPSFA